MENRIGEARRRYAERVGKFTQDDAARFFGVSLSTYKKWEQGISWHIVAYVDLGLTHDRPMD